MYRRIKMEQILKCLKCTSAHCITQKTEQILFEFSYFSSRFLLIRLLITQGFKLVNENLQGYVWVFFREGETEGRGGGLSEISLH